MLKGPVGVGLSLGSWNFLEPFLPPGQSERTRVSGGSGDCPGAEQFRANPEFPSQWGGRRRPRGLGGLGNRRRAGARCGTRTSQNKALQRLHPAGASFASFGLSSRLSSLALRFWELPSKKC